MTAKDLNPDKIYFASQVYRAYAQELQEVGINHEKAFYNALKKGYLGVKCRYWRDARLKQPPYKVRPRNMDKFIQDVREAIG